MLKSTYTSSNPLPPGWSQHTAPSGHVYYYNAETKQSTYKRPVAAPSPPAIDGATTTISAGWPLAAPAASLPSQTGVPFQLPFNQFPSWQGSQLPHGQYQQARRNSRKKFEPPKDRPKSKQAIPGCEPWVLVWTKLGRRFVYNAEKNESFWKFPQDVLMAVIEFDRVEREKKENKEIAEKEQQQEIEKNDAQNPKEEDIHKLPAEEPAGKVEKTAEPQREPSHHGSSDEYEEVEVTDDEEEEGEGESESHRLEAEQQDDQPIEFNEEDIAHQLEAMGAEYGLDTGEYGDEEEEEGGEEMNDGDEGLALTDEDARNLFSDLLDDFKINPYTPWDKIIEEGHIIDDARYTVLPNMKKRREAHGIWSRDRIQKLKEERAKQEKKDPRETYIAFLEKHATPKLYWAEFRRKFRKEPEMKDYKLTDKEREKLYREHVSRLKSR